MGFMKEDKDMWLVVGCFTLFLLLIGVAWGIDDINFLISYWGSALGTALGGMVAVAAALSIWSRQRKEAIALGKRERSIRAAREVSARVAEIYSLASTGEAEPMGPILESNLELIRQQRVAAIPEIAGVEDEELRMFLKNAVRYLTTTKQDVEELDKVAPFVVRAAAVTQAVSQAVADFRDEKPGPFQAVISGERYDVVLKRIAEANEKRLQELRAKLAGYGLVPDSAK